MVAWALSFHPVRRCGRNRHMARRARLAGAGMVHRSSIRGHMAVRFAGERRGWSTEVISPVYSGGMGPDALNEDGPRRPLLGA
ncbi:hypothetical protein E2562_030745 [Oryza meyeriana var. granulata]|uniref:Uncharacterized protein n=1 Tax=Oryza meyeriana var. granulata TaxID=110450 RepID=A0A6G1E4P0_9ORYZ|nr:hypothetical protein E2562_030745 [Oryza meyeriana var. granulata]